MTLNLRSASISQILELSLQGLISSMVYNSKREELKGLMKFLLEESGQQNLITIIIS